MKLKTKQDYLNAHWDMWDWIIDQILKSGEASDIRDLKFHYCYNVVDVILVEDCFLCAGIEDCLKCCDLLGGVGAGCLNGLYRRCFHAKTPHEQAEWAFLIRDLEYKDEI